MLSIPDIRIPLLKSLFDLLPQSEYKRFLRMATSPLDPTTSSEKNAASTINAPFHLPPDALSGGAPTPGSTRYLSAKDALKRKAADFRLRALQCDQLAANLPDTLEVDFQANTLLRDMVDKL